MNTDCEDIIIKELNKSIRRLKGKTFRYLIILCRGTGRICRLYGMNDEFRGVVLGMKKFGVNFGILLKSKKMFAPEVYINRRKRLKEAMGTGILLFPGNTEAAMNYPANTYHFRQDSNFLYFFGLDMPDLFAMINVDEDQEIIFGNDVTMDDVIWVGSQPAMSERAARVGVSQTMPLKAYPDMIRKAMAKGQKVHFLPPYRGETMVQLAELLDKKPAKIKTMASEALIRAVVALREVKEEGEIKEIERAVDISYIMHTTAMKMAKPGVVEREISGTIEGISLANGNPVAFPVILTINGQTLHNHYHGNTLKETVSR